MVGRFLLDGMAVYDDPTRLARRIRAVSGLFL